MSVKKQEIILSKILDNVESFIDIETASAYDFVTGAYFETILQIWSEVGEITPNQINAIKWFSINYAEKSYQGVLDYRFKKYLTQEDEHKFVNDTYRKVFRDIKDTIEYQLPRIISLFESLILCLSFCCVLRRYLIEKPVFFLCKKGYLSIKNKCDRRSNLTNRDVA